MSGVQIFSSQGKVLSAADAKNAEVIAAGLVANGVAHAFESNADFIKWAANTRYADAFSSVEGKLAKVRKHQSIDHSEIEARQRRLVARVEEDMNELASRSKLEANSEALFLKATDQSDPLEGPIFDPVTVFDEVGAGGVFMHLPIGWWPDLGWFAWNDRISSLRLSGLVILREHTWWQGRTLILVGLPYWEYSDLGAFSFDNLASSAQIY